ncbi:MAG: hypothetical protein IK127_03855 [Clostridia bacterium]|nr:hypothetical protein [Clostridia bacterium]
MAELTKNQTIGYLQHAIELESKMVVMDEVIDQFTAKQDARKPAAPSLKSVPSEMGDYHESYWTFIKGRYLNLFLFVFAGIFLLIAVIGFISNASYYGSKEYQLKAHNWSVVSGEDISAYSNSYANSGPKSVQTLSWIMLIAAITMIIITIVLYKKHLKESDFSRIRKNAEIRKERQKAQQSNDVTLSKYNTDLNAWATSRNNGLASLNKNKAALQRMIDKYYEADYVFPKYRNLSALTSIYEYLSSGRCDELTGPNGAYNLYESELRQNLIIAQLSIIIANLEQIRQNQYTLYQEMTKINATTRKISAQLDTLTSYTYTLAELTALNTFYSGVNAANTAAVAYLGTL